MTPAEGVKCLGTGNRNGDGTGIDSTVPGDVPGLTSGVKSLAAGSQSICAVTTAGGAKCWGVNVGASPTQTVSTSPVDVQDLTSGVEQASAGAGYACFLTTTHNVRCFGGNGFGQLGDGTVITSNTVTTVADINGTALSVASGTQSSCIVTTTQSVKCWGYGGYGNLGNGYFGSSSGAIFSSTPVDVFNLTSVSEVAVGDNAACALTTGGAVKCWGRNDVGQLGNGVAGNSSIPVQVSGLSSGVRAIRAGQLHFCAILDTGAMKCWGRNSEGQLGTGSVSNSSNTPVSSTIATGVIVDVSAYLYFTCVLNSEGTLRCFGTHPIMTISKTAANAINGFSSEHVGVRTLTSDKQVLMQGWYPTRFTEGANGMPVNVGVRATTSEDITISSIYFAKGVDNVGPHTGIIWNSAGQVIARQYFVSETSIGWQKIVLDQPVHIPAASTFTVGYSLNVVGYPYGTFFPNTIVGPVTVDKGYYVYSNDVESFPSGTVNTNYGVDFEFIADSALPTTTTEATTTSTSTTTTTEAPTTSTSTTTTTSTTSSTSTTTTVATSSSTSSTSTTVAPLPATTTTTSFTTTTVAPTTSTSTSTSTTIPATTTSTTSTTAPFASVVDIKANSSAAEVLAVVTSIIKDGVNPSQATELASSPKVLETISTEQAATVFDAISVDALSPEQESELVAAVTNAPTEIKNTFESEIDVYGEGLDDYVAVGSNIDVGSRKSLIAATAAVTGIAAGASTSSSSGGSSGGSSSGNRAGRREDE